MNGRDLGSTEHAPAPAPAPSPAAGGELQLGPESARPLLDGWAACTRAGPGKGNEDRSGADGRLFSVADGMGGLLLGDMAAQEAVSTLHGAGPQDAASLRAALAAANDAVRALGADTQAAVGATLAAVLVTSEGVWAISAGDSRVWLVDDDGQVRRLDGTLAERNGVNFDDRRHSDLSRIVTVHLGAEPVLDVEAVAVSVGKRARLLLTTDGVHDSFPPAMLEEIAAGDGDPATVAARLVDAATEAGTTDDATALVVDLRADDLPWRSGR